MFCPRCGTLNNDDNEFCTDCGLCLTQNKKKTQDNDKTNSSNSTTKKFKIEPMDEKTINNIIDYIDAQFNIRIVYLVVLIVVIGCLFLADFISDDRILFNEEKTPINAVVSNYEKFEEQKNNKNCIPSLLFENIKQSYDVEYSRNLKLSEDARNTYFNSDEEAYVFENKINNIQINGFETYNDNIKYQSLNFNSEANSSTINKMSSNKFYPSFINTFNTNIISNIINYNDSSLSDVVSYNNFINFSDISDEWIFKNETLLFDSQTLSIISGIESSSENKELLLKGLKSATKDIFEIMHEDMNLYCSQNESLEIGDRMVAGTEIHSYSEVTELKTYIRKYKGFIKENDDIFNAIINLEDKSININNKNDYEKYVDRIFKIIENKTNRYKDTLYVSLIVDKNDVINGGEICVEHNRFDSYKFILPTEKDDTIVLSFHSDNDKKEKSYILEMKNASKENKKIRFVGENVFECSSIDLEMEVKTLQKEKGLYLGEIDANLHLNKDEKQTNQKIKWCSYKENGKIQERLSIKDKELGELSFSKKYSPCKYKNINMPSKDNIVYMLDNKQKETKNFLEYKNYISNDDKHLFCELIKFIR